MRSPPRPAAARPDVTRARRAAAAVAVAAPAPAHADANCVGTTSTAYVCVDPTGRVLWSDCVYTGGDTCTPVSVPGPTVTCGGAIGCDTTICIPCLLADDDGSDR